MSRYVHRETRCLLLTGMHIFVYIDRNLLYKHLCLGTCTCLKFYAALKSLLT